MEREVYVSINNDIFLDIGKIIKIIKLNIMIYSWVIIIKIKAMARYIFS